MRIRDKRPGIRREDLLAVAKEFGVKRPERILGATRDALDGWERHAGTYDVGTTVRTAIREELDRRAEVRAGAGGEMEGPDL